MSDSRTVGVAPSQAASEPHPATVAVWSVLERDARRLDMVQVRSADLLRLIAAARGVTGVFCDKSDLHHQPRCSEQCEKCADSQGNAGVESGPLEDCHGVIAGEQS